MTDFQIILIDSLFFYKGGLFLKINYLDYLKLQLLFNNFTSRFITKKNAQKLMDKKVDKEFGKGLSENNYTKDDKDKVTKLNFKKLVSECEISGYTITFKDIDGNTIKTFDTPQPTFSIVDGELFVSY